jgi:hypothetical protein
LGLICTEIKVADGDPKNTIQVDYEKILADWNRTMLRALALNGLGKYPTSEDSYWGKRGRQT